MIRRAFFRRMALAAAACAFIDVPWPKMEEEPIGVTISGWEDGRPMLEPFQNTKVVYDRGIIMVQRA